MDSGEYPTLGDCEGDGGAYMERLISSRDMHCIDDGMYFVLRPSKLCGGTGFNGLSCTLAEYLYNSTCIIYMDWVPGQGYCRSKSSCLLWSTKNPAKILERRA